MKTTILDDNALQAILNNSKIRANFVFLQRKFTLLQQKTSKIRKPCCHKRLKRKIQHEIFNEIRNWILGMKPEELKKLKSLTGADIFRIYAKVNGKIVTREV